MNTFFTSDTHFGHRGVLGTGRRHWATTDEMDAALIANWNAVVKPGDTVWHLGDFCWKPKGIGRIRVQLHGTIHLILGNHDRLKASDHDYFASVSHYHEMKLSLPTAEKGFALANTWCSVTTPCAPGIAGTSAPGISTDTATAICRMMGR